MGVALARLLSTIISLVLSALQVWVPTVVLYLSYPRPAHAADPFMDAARQGQSFGLGLLPDASTLGGQDSQGNIQLNWQGKTSTVSPQQLFPDSKNTTNPGSQSTYGNDAAVKNQAQAAVQDMENSQSLTGQAYRTLMEGTNRAHVDRSNMAMWEVTDNKLKEVLENAATAECEPVTTINNNTILTHIPDYKTCERIVYPGSSCKCRHDYEVKNLGQFAAVFSFEWPFWPMFYQLEFQGQHCIGAYGDGGSNCHFPLSINELLPPEACENANNVILRQATNYDYFSVIANKESGCIFNIDLDIRDLTSSYLPGSYQVGLTIYQIIDRGWTCDPGCEALLTNPDGDSFIHPTSFACTFGYNDDCADIAGGTICQSDLTSANPFAVKSISNLCQEVTIDTGSNNFNAGQMKCWTDPQGEVHCPTVNGELTDTCGPLEENPACIYTSQQCIDGAMDPVSGVCYAFSLVFDCGIDVTVNDPQTTTAYICNGEIRCMGEECISGQFDSNNEDFGKAAAALQVAQYAMQDLDCADVGGTGCTLFSGQHMECKKALGGYIDCCQQPEDGMMSLVQYIQLLVNANYLGMAEWELTGVFPGIFATNPLNGAWTTLKTPYDFMEKTISSAWDSLIGESLQDITLSGMKEALSQTLMKGAYNFVNAISPELAESMFWQGFSGAIYLTEAMEMLVSIGSFIMWIYTIYQVLDILAHIIWACEQSELELAAKKQLKVCHLVGSYCNSEVLGICLEKRDSYCCFNSPMARIFHEQIRFQPQVGRPWGEADGPDCRGLSGYDLAQVNWDQVDLSEWMALLNIAGEHPTQKTMTVESLTGAGSPWNFDNNNRSDAIQRTQERLNFTGEDLENLRNQKELQMWGVNP